MDSKNQRIHFVLSLICIIFATEFYIITKEIKEVNL